MKIPLKKYLHDLLIDSIVDECYHGVSEAVEEQQNTIVE